MAPVTPPIAAPWAALLQPFFFSTWGTVATVSVLELFPAAVLSPTVVLCGALTIGGVATGGVNTGGTLAVCVYTGAETAPLAGIFLFPLQPHVEFLKFLLEVFLLLL